MLQSMAVILVLYALIVALSVGEKVDLEPSAKCSPGSLERPQFDEEPKKFQPVTNRPIYTYSAFYEERHTASGPSIRIIAAGLQERFNDIDDLYCTFWYDDQDDAISVGPVIYKVIYPSLGHGDMWVSHFILCELPNNGENNKETKSIPYAVSVTDEPCAQPENKLMVLNREPIPPHEKKGHAMCFQPLYNSFRNWTMVIEMFELHRLLGAEAIGIYSYSTGEVTKKVLEHYQKESTSDFDVQVMPWPFPHFKSSVFCQRATLNDCYYRMRNKYKYITVHDLDEVLVPRMVRTWPDLLSKISKDNYGVYLFQHAYHRRNYSLQQEEHQELISQSSFWRTDKTVPAGKIRSKAMYNSDLAVSLDLHFPYQLVEGAKEYILDPSEGILHHYRSYPMESFAKHPENYNYIEDKYMEWMKEDLTEAFDKKVNELGFHSRLLLAKKKNKEHTEL